MKLLKLGSRGDDVKRLKRILNKFGYGLNVENPNFLTATEAAVKAFQGKNNLKPDGEVGPATWPVLLKAEAEPVNGATLDKQAPPPWITEARKYEGQKESSSKLAAVMVPLWAKLFGRNLNSIQKYAWCGLAVAAGLAWAGLPVQKGGEMAKAWANYGVAIDYKKNGTPEGAIVGINNKGDCKNSANNHVSYADGYCTAADLLKKGGTIALYGGNQGNMWKDSNYSAAKICFVRWPAQWKFPAPVTKSVGCHGGKEDKGESTR